jgi:hypothetical protein
MNMSLKNLCVNASVPKGTYFFGLLSPMEHEDLAAIYLQVQRGYAVLPSSSKSSTQAYECVLVHRETGERAALQVKSGAAGLDVSSLSELPSKVFVIVAEGASDVAPPANVELIDRADLLAFARTQRQLMPQRIQEFMKWTGA